MTSEGHHWRDGTRSHSVGDGFALERGGSSILSLSR